jgi:hypothetical protein
MASARIHKRLRLAAALCAASVGLMIGTVSTASATPAPAAAAPQVASAHSHKHVMGMRGPHARATAASSGLLYGGGPVEHTPRVYLVFWGSQWDSDGNGVESYLQNYFSGVGTGSDNWSTIMTQYPDNNGAPAFGSSVLGGVWVDDGSAAPGTASQSQLSDEANNGASHFGVSGPDADIFVVSPSGTHPDNFPNSGFCAWHDWNGNVAYTNMPYVLDAGSSCGANSVQNSLDGFSIVGGHEYAEAVTDPEPSSGWVDSSGEEIGDLCAWQGLTTLSLPAGSFAIQPLWSNSAGGCAASG